MTTTYTNHGTTTLKDLQLTLAAPKGWKAVATSHDKFASVKPGQTVTATWTVTPAGRRHPRRLLPARPGHLPGRAVVLRSHRPAHPGRPRPDDDRHGAERVPGPGGRAARPSDPVQEARQPHLLPNGRRAATGNLRSRLRPADRSAVRTPVTRPGVTGR
ncbi:NEW3 domain-containing protein [Kitasatospora paracochleata]|uniref:NEW3 domain-containing protein n=1 Tax=Kitasatospora paracochleata TaxID=58354 RepID=UPI003898FF70